jgi:hypothetical protein
VLFFGGFEFSFRKLLNYMVVWYLLFHKNPLTKIPIAMKYLKKCVMILIFAITNQFWCFLTFSLYLFICSIMMDIWKKEHSSMIYWIITEYTGEDLLFMIYFSNKNISLQSIRILIYCIRKFVFEFWKLKYFSRILRFFLSFPKTWMKSEILLIKVVLIAHVVRCFF